MNPIRGFRKFLGKSWILFQILTDGKFVIGYHNWKSRKCLNKGSIDSMCLNITKLEKLLDSFSDYIWLLGSYTVCHIIIHLFIVFLEFDHVSCSAFPSIIFKLFFVDSYPFFSTLADALSSSILSIVIIPLGFIKNRMNSEVKVTDLLAFIPCFGDPTSPKI